MNRLCCISKHVVLSFISLRDLRKMRTQIRFSKYSWIVSANLCRNVEMKYKPVRSEDGLKFQTVKPFMSIMPSSPLRTMQLLNSQTGIINHSGSFIEGLSILLQAWPYRLPVRQKNRFVHSQVYAWMIYRTFRMEVEYFGWCCLVATEFSLHVRPSASSWQTPY